MLFTDQLIVTQADMLRIDSEVSAVNNATALQAKTTVVSLDVPGGFCETVVSDITNKISSAIQLMGGYPTSLGITGNHQMAVNFGVGGSAMNGLTAPTNMMSQIVTHSAQFGFSRMWSPLKVWAVYFALGAFYQEASNRKKDDRYATKMDSFKNEAESRWVWLMKTGLPLVQVPFPAPGAYLWRGAGAFSASNNITFPTQAGAVGGSYQVAICWVRTDTYQPELPDRGDSESGYSAVQTVTVPSGGAIRVSIAGLNPPDGSPAPVGMANGVVPTIKAQAWQVFVGKPVAGGSAALMGDLWLQNSAPIPLGTQTFTLPSDPILSGSLIREGQNPLGQLQFVNRFPRV
jgi:hypothetical protein